MTRRITIEIAVPDEARWMTTGGSGTLHFWAGKRPIADDELGWCAPLGHSACVHSIPTGIECPHWRDTLTDLSQVTP